MRIDGADSAARISRWHGDLDAESRERIMTARDAASGLEVTTTMRRLPGRDAAEWLLELENTGEEDAPLVEDILPLDWTMPMGGEPAITIHHANGSLCRVDDFLPQDAKLRVDDELVIEPTAGRSSDGAFPFVNIDWGTGGLALAIGWSGGWRMTFQRSENALRVTAGMARASLSLKPGERVRTPRILAVRWNGDDPDIGTNLLRRTILDNYTPRDGDGPALPPISHPRQLVFYLTGHAGEEDSIRAIGRARELGLEAFWVDACWYGEGGDWASEVGTWDVRRDRFPRGLKPVADASHENDMKFILWFEPERVQAGTRIHREHPEFLLSAPGNDSTFLLDLGNSDARRYITDMISDTIAEVGIDIYRQDFNMDPAPHWKAADTSDRIGMAEIRHIEGLYAMWDELKERHPGLLIDNCASGGRRLDLETTRRSYPLWRSDYTDVGAMDEGNNLQIGAQSQTAGLSRWIPLHSASVWTFEPYDVRSSFSTGLTLYTDILAEDYPVEQVKAAVEEVKRLRPYLLGDMHLLVPLTVERHDWCAYQFHRPDLGAGCAVFLRRDESPFLTMAAGLREIEDDARYEISLSRTFDQEPFHEIGTWDLKQLTVSIPSAPGSVLLEYRRV